MSLTGRVDLSGALAQMRAAAEQGARLAAEHVLQVSNTRVPIEEATLERSGATSLDVDGDHIRAAISYDAVYAARQHEELTWRHADGRQAKYLESALLDEADVCARIMAREIKAATGD